MSICIKVSITALTIFLCFENYILILCDCFCYRGGLAEILCKPKILPLKSAVLEQLQKIEREAEAKEESNFEPLSNLNIVHK